MKIVHVNVRSLLPNFDEIKCKFLDGTFDIVALSETWLHKQCSSSLIETNGYHLFRQDRTGQDRKVATNVGVAFVFLLRAHLMLLLGRI